MDVVSTERGPKWRSLKWRSLKWMWSQIKTSHMNVVSNEQVSKERGLKWSWPQMNWSKLNVVSNVVVSNERGPEWIGLSSHGNMLFTPLLQNIRLNWV